MAEAPKLFDAIEAAQNQIDRSAADLRRSLRGTEQAQSREARRAAARAARRDMRNHALETLDIVRATQQRVLRDNQREQRLRDAAEASQLRRSEVRRITQQGPLRQVLERHAGGAADSLERLLEESAALNRRPERTAEMITDLVGGDPAEPKGLHAKSLLIARTELARADREAKAAMWARDPSIKQWVWKARLSANTCPMCWAMHGTLHPAGTPMASHPSCLCVMVPLVDGQKLLVPGADQFERLSKAEQRVILGPRRFDLYTSGRLQLDQSARGVVQRTTSSDWGPSRRVRPLS